MVSLFRQIIQQNPPLQSLSITSFGPMIEINENNGELILEILLNSNIESIINFNIGNNSSWFKHPFTKEERFSNVELLTEFISKQAGLQNITLDSILTSIATLKILTMIAENYSIMSNI